MNVTLRPELERFVEEKVRAGEYRSPSEVVNDALATMMGQEQFSPEDVEELRREVMIGIEEHHRGQSTPLDMDAIKAQVRAQEGI